ncbi:MAG: hypothetical protein IPN86_03405 [Saprospiraceae bacterium]|nr:hypothetical protein [Saprospiraceae bacterium]
MIDKQGKIIAAFGIPGSGKSTTTTEIGKILRIETFHEPEESDWAEAVSLRELVGNFTALMWFRSIRVPQYFKANEIKKKGNLAMLDSCYDKLFYLYCNKKGLEWLFTKDDLYYDEMLSIAKKDYENLPDIDILIFFEQSKENWEKFLTKRNRNLDNDNAFRDSFILQKAFIETIKEYCKEKNCHLIVHQQSFSTPQIEARKIIEQLKKYL